MPKNKELWDLEIEGSLVGSILIDSAQFKDCGYLDPVAFHDQSLQEIWRVFQDLDKTGEPLERNIILHALETSKLESVKWDPYLSKLATTPESSQSARSYCRIVADYQVRRRMLAEAQALTIKAYDLKIPVPESALVKRKTLWNIGELMSAEFPDPTGPVPGIFPIGLTILGGRPKRGKSWLMLQCAYSLSVGGKFLNQDLTKNRVLYYALEDTPRRLKDRLSKFNPEKTALIDFERELKPLYAGGIEQIETAANEYNMIVIDTLGRAMPGRDFTKDAGILAEVLGRLQTIALEKNISIVIILHTRKPSGSENDPIDDILGSTQGLTAAPDCVLAIYREQGKPGARLLGRGRDFDDIDLTIEFDPITCAWQLVGETGAVRLSDKEEQILEAMKEMGKAKVSTIAAAINEKRPNTDLRLKDLYAKGKVQKEVIEGVTFYYLHIQHIQDIQPIQAILDIQAV